MDTFYRERCAGRWTYWTYSDGRRYTINSAWATREIQRGTAKLVTVQ